LRHPGAPEKMPMGRPAQVGLVSESPPGCVLPEIPWLASNELIRVGGR
jgi:hypothetical protein